MWEIKIWTSALTWDIASSSAEGIFFIASWAASLSCKNSWSQVKVAGRKNLKPAPRPHENQPGVLLHDSKEGVSQQTVFLQRAREA